MVFAFPPFETFGLGIFLGYGLLYLFLDQATKGEAAILGFAIGVAKTFCLLNWAFVSLPQPFLALLLASTALGLNWCLWCTLIWALLRRKNGWIAWCIIPAGELILAAPLVNLCAYCCTPHAVAGNAIFLSAARWIGYFGISLLISSLSLAISLGIYRGNRRVTIAGIVIFAFWVACGITVTFGGVKPNAEIRPFQVTIGQVFHPRNASSTPHGETQLRQSLDALTALTKHDILILPEVVLYESANDYPTSSMSIEELDAYLQMRGLVGLQVAAGCETGCDAELGTFRNSLVVFKVGSCSTRSYVDKQVPAIVGEIPLAGSIPVLRSWAAKVFGSTGKLVSRSTGSEVNILARRAGIRICSEQMIPDQLMPGSGKADFVLVIGDTSWFNYSTFERMQSRAARQILAAERGVPLIYAANGGSEVISPKGRVLHSLDPSDHGGSWLLSF